MALFNRAAHMGRLIWEGPEGKCEIHKDMDRTEGH